jgi:hypothetical protein
VLHDARPGNCSRDKKRNHGLYSIWEQTESVIPGNYFEEIPGVGT